MLSTGDVIDRRYRIVEVLGSGAMGVVYKAQHTTLTHRMVALKVVHAQLTVEGDFLERFEREAQSASRVEHPNAVTIYDYGRTEDGFPYLAMEYVDGPSLAKHIAAHPRGLPVEEAVSVAVQIAAALEAVHGKGIVHRDLKPENVVLTGGGAAKVLDFGIAKATEGTQLSKTGMAIGTPAYMAPEQWRGEELDGRADQYALGVIVYEMLCGRGPFQSQSPTGYLHKHLMEEAPSFAEAQKRARVPAAVEAVVRRALEKEASRRYGSIGEFSVALTEASGGAETLVQPKPTERMRRPVWRRSRPKAAVPAAIAAALAIAVAGVWLVPERGSSEAAQASLLGDGLAAAEPARLRVAADAPAFARVGGREYPVAQDTPAEIELTAGVYEVVIRSAADPAVFDTHPTVRLVSGETAELSASFASAPAGAASGSMAWSASQASAGRTENHAPEGRRVRTIRLDQRVDGWLSSSDPLHDGNAHYQDYVLNAARGEIQIDLTSSDFDTYLRLGRMESGRFVQLASNDDGGEGLNAQLRYAVPSPGEYVIRATSYRAGATGAYMLNATSARATLPTLRLGQQVNGRLSSSDPRYERDAYYRDHLLDAPRGEVQIEMTSSEFDTYIRLGRMESGRFVQLASDDDGGEGLNSRLRYSVPSAGQYVIRATSYSAGATGGYVLGATRVTSPRPGSRAIRIGQLMNGRLTSSDPRHEGGAHYHDYVLNAPHGGIQIDLTSSDFDTYLRLGRMQSGRFVELAVDDDGGESLNARLRYTLPSAGDYVIRATSYREGATGAYILGVGRW